MVTVHTSTTVIETPVSDDTKGSLSGTQLELLYRDVAKEIAREFSRVVTGDIQHVWEDMKRQYREHNQLLSRQEWCVQELKACLYPEGSSKALPDIPPAAQKILNSRENCILDSEHVVNTSRPQGLIQVPDCFCNIDSGVPLVEASSIRREASVKPELAGERPQEDTPIRMSPRPSKPTLPLDHDPHGISPEFADFGEHMIVDAMKAPAAGDVMVVIDDPPTDVVDIDAPKVASWDAAGSLKVNPPGATESRGFDESNEDLIDRQDKKRKSIPKIVDRDPYHVKRVGADDLATETYKVEKYYHETGLFRKIATNDIFGNITLAVIGANAVYIGVDADNNHEDNLTDADMGFQICEHLFCVFFTFEWIVRFGSFKNKCNCMRDMWFKFDTALVLMMVVETWVMPIAFAGAGSTGIPTGLIKMLRLLRLARMARLMRSLPELMAMIKGVKQASRAVGSALLLLVILVYVFAIIMFTLLKDEKDPLIQERFKRLGTVMVTLVTDGAFMDGIGYVSRILLNQGQYVPECVFMIFVLLSALTVMNMLIGVLCEVVTSVAAAEKEDGQIKLVKDRLLYMLKELDEDKSGMISRYEVAQVLDDVNALSVLHSINVDVKCLLEELNLCFEDSEELAIHQIMEVILMLRGDRQPSMKDLIHSRQFAFYQHTQAFGHLAETMTGELSRISRTSDGVACLSEPDETAQDLAAPKFGKTATFVSQTAQALGATTVTKPSPPIAAPEPIGNDAMNR